MTKKANSRTTAIIEALKTRPEAKPKELAAEFGVAVSYVYQVRKRMNNKPKRKVTISPSQVGIARAMGVPLDEYVKEGLKLGV